MRALTTTPAQIRETMGRLDYFREWTEAQLNAVAAAARILSVPKGHRLAQKGRPLPHLYIIISGEFRFFIPLSGGEERVVGVLGNGQSFGEGCLVLATPCPYTALATRPGHVLAIDAPAFLHELQRSNLLLRKCMTLFAQRLMGVMTDLETSAHRSSLQRVACYLSQHGPPAGTEAYTVALAGRKMDVAARLGLTAETFSRVLSQLEQEGIVRIQGRRIQVLDAERLRGLNPATGRSRGCLPDDPSG
jgi:CRP-like cAMP-binding protein